MSFTDRSWMYRFGRKRNQAPEFAAGLRTFLQFSLNNPGYLRGDRLIACPCRKCLNGDYFSEDVVARHLMSRGFGEGYYTWVAQGEVVAPAQSWASTSAPVQPLQDMETMPYYPPEGQFQYNNFEGYQEVANVAEPPSESVYQGEVPNEVSREYLDLLQSHNVPVNDGSGKTVLQLVAELLAGKVKHSLSHDAFNYFLQAVRSAMPPSDAERIPKDFYETRKFFSGIRLGATVFDVCVNDCIIYTATYESRTKCPYCKVNRYEDSSKIPRKRLWYFPIIERLQRLFYCPKVARQMTWHLQCRGEDEEIIHPSGAEAWKKFDEDFPSFAAEPRNPRVGICMDGVNPFYSSSNYSIWPVFITVYNLPPEMCMKQEFIFLAMLIQGPRGPGKNVDVMLRPLINDLNTLWHEGVVTYDAHTRENFIMRAALLWSITDYPGLGMASSWSTHGKLSCPICMERTNTFWLTNGKKFSFFDCHRKFLPCNHTFRRNKTDFTPGKACHKVEEPRRDGEEVYAKVLELRAVIPGKSRKPNDQIAGYGVSHNWTQRSIFWELEYWPTLLVRHNLDVMHIEKNFFDNLFFTLLDDPGKTKDNVNARRDLKDLGFNKRKNLYIIDGDDGKVYKPRATYTVSKDDKRAIFDWVRKLKFPDGFAANVGNCFNLETLHVSGMKSHDCHVFLQKLLPVAFDMLPPQVWDVIAEISMFFRRLGAPHIRVSEMAELEKSIVVTICKLERLFPPSFFDSMEHLPIHLPYEARVCGPVQYRWMYPFERRMKSLKRDTKNKARPEGSICEAYLDLEIVNFCTLYFADEIDTYVTDRLSRNEVRTNPYPNDYPQVFERKGEPFGPRMLFRTLTTEEYNQLYIYILRNCDEVDPFLSAFDEERCQGMSETEVQATRASQFVSWFRMAVFAGMFGANKHHEDLARGPSRQVQQYKGYKVNGYRFHTRTYGVTKGTSNSGVCVRGTVSEGGDASDYYGVLEDIIQVEFSLHSIVLFKCHWYDTTSDRGVWRHPAHGLVEINPRRKYPIEEPFVLATQASQVYYTPIPGTRVAHPRKNWVAVFSTRPRNVIQGYTELAVQDSASSDDEDTQQDPRGILYQDNNLPRLQTQASQAFGNDLDNFNLATGEYVQLPRPPLRRTQQPTTAELFNNDTEEEYHESDSE